MARLVEGDEDAIRGVIHWFNETGMVSLDLRWAGGRPRLVSLEDEAFIVATATTRPEALEQSFTRWSLRKIAAYLTNPANLSGQSTSEWSSGRCREPRPAVPPRASNGPL
jgi:transposase